MQPLIAISVGEVINLETGQNWTPVIYGQFRTYSDAVVRAGGAPFIMPLVEDETVLKRLYEQCHGLLLSGGHDLEPANRNAVPARIKISTSPHRDRQEKQLLKWALQDNKPVLGICRGMQLINVVLGGNLHHDIENELATDVNHTLNIDKKDFHHLTHRLELVPGSQLAAILGKQNIPTNSLHHQAINKVGKGLVVTARAEDGMVEAIELPDKRFVIGVQSHPEALEAATERLWRKLFKAFVDSCPA
jgi:putative glutamine amidotransferase